MILFYVIAGVAYTTSTPIFEAGDEIWHFGYVQHIRDTGDIPTQTIDDATTLYREHGNQPPLYYATMALLTSPFSIDDADSYRTLNPYVVVNQPDAFGNKNLVIQDSEHQAFDGTRRVVTIIRGLGLVLGIITIITVNEISKFIAPHRPTVALVATALTALNPMFIFISASVNNTTLAMAFNGLIVLLMLHTMRNGFSLRWIITLAILISLAAITKLASLVLIPVVLGVGLFTYYKTKDRNGFILFVVTISLFVLVIAGWWYVRNIQLYGELFGIHTMATIMGERGVTFSLATLLGEYQQFRMSYWGLFGALNIPITPIFYVLGDVVTFLSILGSIFLLLQLIAISDLAYARYELSNLTVILSAFLLLWFAVLYIGTLTEASDGSILFPLISVTSPLVAVGFVEMVWWMLFSVRPSSLNFVRATDAVPKTLLNGAMIWGFRLLAIITLLTPFTVIRDLYTPPTPVTNLPPTLQPVYAEFGGVTLIGYEHSDRRYTPGEDVHVTLYWQVQNPSENDNSIFLSFVDDRAQSIGRYTTYPGAGTLRTSTWQAGQIYPDRYVIRLDQNAFGRYPFDLQVEWENLAIDQPIPAINAEDQLISPIRLNIGAIASMRNESQPQGFTKLPTDAQPVFGDMIRLSEFLFDPDYNELILHWQTDSTPNDKYTVFVHVLDEDGNIIAQADVPPRLPTSYWRLGESNLTHHIFPDDVNLLDHQVIVGWYINDDRLDYTTVIDDEEVVFNTFEIPWDITYDELELTPEVSTAEAPPDTSQDSKGD
jgi:hypothetical protein